MSELLTTLSAWGSSPGDIFELCAIDPGKKSPPSSRRFLVDDLSSLAKAEEFTKAFNGERNLYIGANPLIDSEGGRAKSKGDVIDHRTQRTVLLDVDPPKGVEFTDSLSGRIRRTVELILSDYLEVKAPMLDSGRGVQCWLMLSDDIPADEVSVWAHRLIIGCKLWAQHKGLEGEVDATHDATRLMRLPGTINLKTRRVATWINGSQRGEPITLERLKQLNLPEVVEKSSVLTWSGDPPSDEEVSRWIVEGGKAHSLWHQQEIADRSKRDAMFTLALREQSCPAEVVCRLLGNLPSGKMACDDRGADYFNSTLAWADARVNSTFELCELKSSDDPEELLYSDDQGEKFLAALAKLDGRAYAGMRRDLKSKGVSIGQLDKLVKDTKKNLKATGIFGAYAGVQQPEQKLRLTTRDGIESAWYAQLNGGWTRLKSQSAARLIAKGIDAEDPDTVLRQLLERPFEVVDIPFGSEHPEELKWNLNGAQLAVEPAQGDWSTWKVMLDHLGQGLDEAVENDGWCKLNGVTTGGEFLLLWIAALFQCPDSKLPYLFLFSEACGTGKSSLHESIAQLYAKGAMDLKGNLTGGKDFNGELEGVGFGYLDEMNLGGKASAAYNQIKYFTMADFFKCHPKGLTPFRARCRLRIIHTANNRNYVPVFPGDDRVILIEVDSLNSSSVLGRDTFRRKIQNERAAFLWHLLHEVKLPEHNGRHRVPVLYTEAKGLVQAGNESMLTDWIKRHPEWINWTTGRALDEFTLECFGRGGGRGWTTQRFLRALPDNEAKLRRICDAIQNSGVNEWRGSAREAKEKFQLEGPVRSIGRAFSTLCNRGSILIEAQRKLDGIQQYKFDARQLRDLDAVA